MEIEPITSWFKGKSQNPLGTFVNDKTHVISFDLLNCKWSINLPAGDLMETWPEFSMFSQHLHQWLCGSHPDPKTQSIPQQRFIKHWSSLPLYSPLLLRHSCESHDDSAPPHNHWWRCWENIENSSRVSIKSPAGKFIDRDLKILSQDIYPE